MYRALRGHRWATNEPRKRPDQTDCVGAPTTILIAPLSCGCGSAGVLICLGNENRAVSLRDFEGTPTLSVLPSQAATRTGRVACHAHRHPNAVCCITGSPEPVSFNSTERPNTAKDLKFVTLRLWLKVDGEFQSFEGYMDTGARVSLMSETLAKELQLDFSHNRPRTLKPFGGEVLDAIGFAPQVPLRTICRSHYEREDFYVVADGQMPEKKDAYLSLDLIMRLDHMVRPACRECDLTGDA
jgi:hypothetical protein